MMASENTVAIISTLNAKLSRKLRVPLGVIPVYPSGNTPDADAGTYYLIDTNRITLFQDDTTIAAYGSGQKPLIRFFLDHCPENKRREAAVILASSPQFWRLKSILDIPAGPLPVGHLFQTAASTSALLALLFTWLYVNHYASSDIKPVGVYMCICFVLALCSIARIGDWLDDIRSGTPPGIDYARRLGLLLAALVPFYYCANINHSLLEKPLQYTLLSTTAAAVCMSFFNNRT